LIKLKKIIIFKFSSTETKLKLINLNDPVGDQSLDLNLNNTLLNNNVNLVERVENLNFLEINYLNENLNSSIIHTNFFQIN
jgi:hypothetical protein